MNLFPIHILHLNGPLNVIYCLILYLTNYVIAGFFEVILLSLETVLGNRSNTPDGSMNGKKKWCRERNENRCLCNTSCPSHESFTCICHQQPPPQENGSLTSKVADGEVLVFGVFLWRFEGELLPGTRQILVFSTKRLDHLFNMETRTEIFSFYVLISTQNFRDGYFVIV